MHSMQLLFLWIGLMASSTVNMQEHENLLSAMSAEGYKFFLDLVHESNLASKLSGAGPFTILLPNHDAFDWLKPSILQEIRTEPNRLGALILGHVLPKRLLSHDIENEATEATLLGDRVQFKTIGEFSVNGSNIVKKDIKATNGVIHVIDDVIAFQSIKKNKEDLKPLLEILQSSKYDIFRSFLEKIGFFNVLLFEGPFTLFVPSNEAFSNIGRQVVQRLKRNSAFLRTILFTHIVSGEYLINEEPKIVTTIGGLTLKLHENSRGPFANDSLIKTKNIEASNGVIHEVTELILPTIQETIVYPDGKETDKKYVLVLKSLKEMGFNAFATLMEYAKLDPILSQEGPLTFFVPTNKAFTNLNKGVISQLKSDTTLLQKFLLQHVIRGHLTAKTLGQGWMGQSYDGSKIQSHSTRRGRVSVKGANVLMEDIEIQSVIVHVIDEVFLPVRQRTQQLLCYLTRNSQTFCSPYDSLPPMTNIITRMVPLF